MSLLNWLQTTRMLTATYCSCVSSIKSNQWTFIVFTKLKLQNKVFLSWKKNHSCWSLWSILKTGMYNQETDIFLSAGRACQIPLRFYCLSSWGWLQEGQKPCKRQAETGCGFQIPMLSLFFKLCEGNIILEHIYIKLSKQVYFNQRWLGGDF